MRMDMSLVTLRKNLVDAIETYSRFEHPSARTFMTASDFAKLYQLLLMVVDSTNQTQAGIDALRKQIMEISDRVDARSTILRKKLNAIAKDLV